MARLNRFFRVPASGFEAVTYRTPRRSKTLVLGQKTTVSVVFLFLPTRLRAKKKDLKKILFGIDMASDKIAPYSD